MCVRKEKKITPDNQLATFLLHFIIVFFKKKKKRLKTADTKKKTFRSVGFITARTPLCAFCVPAIFMFTRREATSHLKHLSAGGT